MEFRDGKRLEIAEDCEFIYWSSLISFRRYLATVEEAVKWGLQQIGAQQNRVLLYHNYTAIEYFTPTFGQDF